MKIYLIRHGFAYHNLAYDEMGTKAYNDPKYFDALLTPLGENQAKEAGKKLINIKFNRIYCSPLLRCIQTLDNLFPASKIIMDTIFNAPKNDLIVLDDRIMESQTEICNKRHEKVEIEKFVMSNYNKKFDLSNVEINYNFKVETELKFTNRIKSFISDISKIHNDEEVVLIVSHYSWLKKFFEIYTGKGYEFNNCEIKIVDLN